MREAVVEKGKTARRDPVLGAEGAVLFLYMQKDLPGADKESNWLPAPDSPIYVAMRLYRPKQEALNGSWKPPAVQLTK